MRYFSKLTATALVVRTLLRALLVGVVSQAFVSAPKAQPVRYTLANAHAHNDYLHTRPFHDAYALGFGSIEVDIFLVNGKLHVAHSPDEIRPDRTFRDLYLNPLLEKIRQNGGWPYPGRRGLQLLIDIKNTGQATLAALREELAPHRDALRRVRIVISGEMPAPDHLADQDELFTFDGRKDNEYPAESLARVELVSGSLLGFGPYWDGRQPLDAGTHGRILAFVREQHARGKLVRLWATPDTELGYRTLQELGVDYIGTDDLDGLAAFVGR